MATRRTYRLEVKSNQVLLNSLVPILRMLGESDVSFNTRDYACSLSDVTISIKAGHEKYKHEKNGTDKSCNVFIMTNMLGRLSEDDIAMRQKLKELNPDFIDYDIITLRMPRTIVMKRGHSIESVNILLFKDKKGQYSEFTLMIPNDKFFRIKQVAFTLCLNKTN